ncbi:double-strand break repair protein AddB [Acidocella aquatica]|uniref:Double-strand break repair protein AddB n=1 Tax=Acidocella aquatica TaxID=1922313 RepID=A0ABQ6A2A6_9PROT|nr:double-strand break repair protein AddB [Acidocella aquatica]GLR65533.1 double-strand break repair protein AddB [Acidocella aquatica]
MRLGAFTAEAAFLPALAKRWLETGGDSADGLILLPSRRAAQALAGAFLEQNQGKALLLPRIVALGAIDEAGLTLAGALDLPPAIPPMQRQAVLARLILRMNGQDGAPQKLHAAWQLAAELAGLLDEAAYAEVDLAATLPNVVAAELASHWQTTLKFLEIITHLWPGIVAGMGGMDPAARLVALLDAQTAAWGENPPPHRVWMVAAEGNPAIGRLARRVAGLPEGLLLLPGYDFELSEAAWEALDDSHAQGGIARLLAEIGARPAEVTRLPAPASPVPAGRSLVFSRALLPAACLEAWQNTAAFQLAGLSRLEAQEEAQNATAIAMILRDALEVPGRTAALITPDRGLAARVTAALKRFGITADDSAGEPLSQTPPAIFLRLLARAVVSGFAPLPLLALLKHPLAAAGLPPEMCRAHARNLEIHALRGARPGPGFDDIKFRLEQAKLPAVIVFLERLEAMLRPAGLPERSNPAQVLRHLLTVAEALCATPEEPGAARLWPGEAGIALSEIFLQALEVFEDLPDIAGSEAADLLDALLSGAVVRKPRTKDGHPRVAIWGLQEAALQSVDVAVLGGLVEGVWPAPAEPGPWLSRPMRRAAKLPSPEQKIGMAAHGFFSLATCCETVVLAAPARRERAPAVPARWLTRLQAMLHGQGLPAHPAASWSLQLDQPVRLERRERPYPRPPAAARPTRLSISDFATLMADPYAIYARKILRIHEIDPLDEESDQSLFGEIVHKGLEEFYDIPENFAAPDARARLVSALQNAMRERRPRAALDHWWMARLARIADWVLESERARRGAHGAPVDLASEVKAELAVPGGFVLSGRADRIEKRVDGTVSILDYKTGAAPASPEVEAGSAPQLPLEAVMAQAGCFGDEFSGEVAQLAYWKISGRHEAGEVREVKPKKPRVLREMIEDAAHALPQTFAKFADEKTPYLASPHPKRVNKYDVYAGVSRRAEWAGEDDANDGD